MFISNNLGLSVVVSTYNSVDLLRKTLDSLCLQSLSIKKYEVIIVDDGSSDNTKELINQYLDKIKINYHYQKDKGFRVAKVRNLGIKNSNFNRVLFLDAGMVASHNLLKKHYDYAHVLWSL